MPDSQVVQAALEYKAELNNALTALTIELAEPWVGIDQYIRAKVRSWETDFDAAGVITEEVEMQWLRERVFYQEMQAQLHQQVADYQGVAEEKILLKRLQMSEQGLSQAQELIRRSNVGVLPTGFNMFPAGDLEALIGRFRSGPSVSNLLKTLSWDSINAVEASLVNGLALGEPLQVIADAMADASHIGLSRALTIARTEVISARRISTFAQYRESANVLEGWRRMANPRSACMACLMLDGKVYPISETLEDHPNGACTAVPIVKGAPMPDWETGEAYFLSLPESEQIERMGRGRYEAWKAGQFDLKDMVSWSHSDTWGNTPTETPLWKLVGFNSYAEQRRALSANSEQ